jgi:hypothetical protein
MLDCPADERAALDLSEGYDDFVNGVLGLVVLCLELLLARDNLALKEH